MVRHRRVVWTDEARRGLEEAVEFLARSSPTAAIRLLDAALDAAASLGTLSERGRLVPELRESGVREIFVQTYRLMYEARPVEVRIIAFLHAARDFARWWEAQRRD